MAFTLTCQDAKASDHVIKGHISFSGIPVKCSFDLGSFHSFIFSSFSSKLDVSPVVMDIVLPKATPLVGSLEIEWLYRNCVIQIDGRTLLADLFY